MAELAETHGSRKSAFAFEEDEWRSFEQALAPIDNVLRGLASDYGMRWQAHASKGWPGRALRKRRLLKTYILQVSLDPGYVRSGLVTWDIVDLWMYDYGELIHKTVSNRMLASSSDLNLQITGPIIVSAVESALS